MCFFRPLEGSLGMLQRLPRKLVRGQVIFLVLVDRGDAVRVRGKLMEFGCSLVPVTRHGFLR
jgi:hypothetical protein